MKKIIAALSFSVVFTLLEGCASQATVQGMTASRTIQAPALGNRIAVSDVGGGKQTNPLWTSQVSNENFDAALKASLKAAGLLSGPDGRYKLSANLLDLQQPVFGLALTVTSTVRYVLTDSTTGKVLLQENIVLPYTAGFGDSAMAIKRLRLANEGAIRVNIDALLTKLEKLDINAVSLK